MVKKFLRYCSTLFFLVCLFLTITTAANAQSTSSVRSSSKPFPATQNCAHLQVYLHGKEDPSITCQDSVSSSLHPNGISPSGCDSHSFILWSDADFSGYTICFKGAGATDLTSYCLPWYDGGCAYSWNDWASSYAPGCSSGQLYYDIGEQNVLLSFNSSTPRGNLNGSQNDAVSSIRLDSNC